MNIEAKARQLVMSIPESDDLRLPNHRSNIYKVMPTLLSFLGYQFPQYQSLSEIPEHRAIFEENDCYNNENIVHLVVDSIGCITSNNGVCTDFTDSVPFNLLVDILRKIKIV